MKKLALILGFSVFSIILYGQVEANKNTQFFIGYFGEAATHPGINLGIEQTLFQTNKCQILLSGNGGAYVHFRNNTSYFIRTQLGQRITCNSGIFLENFLGLGYLHQFTHGGEVHEVLPNGALEENPKKGSPQFMPSIAAGVGYDLSKKHGHGPAFYARPEMFLKVPFNGDYQTHFAINAGIIINI